jgi:alanine racemase
VRLKSGVCQLRAPEKFLQPRDPVDFGPRRMPRSCRLYPCPGCGHKAAMARPERIPRPATARSASETGGRLAIDLAAVETNWRTLARQLPGVECAAVVKADGYGLGLEAVAGKLARAGCKTFFVADVTEARRVRASAAEATIYVLDGYAADLGDAIIDIKARPVINSMTELAEWDAFVAARNWHGGAALHIDTGMRRLGISPEEAVALAPRAQTEHHGIALVMSHLACAEQPDHPLNASQIELFREVRALYAGISASLANSSGIFLGDSAHFDLARPGAALYGVNPTPGRPNPMKSVVELTGRILQLRNVAPDQTVGYGATWTAKRPTRIAVVALGYADGLLRAAGGPDGKAGAQAIIAATRCPIVGRISMDLMCIDITDLPDGSVHRGDRATLIGGSLTVDDLAASAGTIGYEVLTRLGPRCHLTYLGDS